MKAVRMSCVVCQRPYLLGWCPPYFSLPIGCISLMSNLGQAASTCDNGIFAVFRRCRARYQVPRHPPILEHCPMCQCICHSRKSVGTQCYCCCRAESTPAIHCCMRHQSAEMGSEQLNCPTTITLHLDRGCQRRRDNCYHWLHLSID